MPSKRELENEESKSAIPFVEKYDAYILIEDVNRVIPKKKRKLNVSNSRHFDVESILKILESGFGDRVQSMEQYSPEDGRGLVIGLLINAETCKRIIDRGPSADSDEAASFRALWGQKCEMRKFADGSICEAVLWKADSAMERRQIINQIAKYLLNKHFNIPTDCIHLTQNVVETVLFSNLPVLGTGEEQFRALCEAYEKLSGILRSLDGMPLTLIKMQAISASLRHTEVFPSAPIPKGSTDKSVDVRGNCFVPRPNGSHVPPWTPSQEVHITLETSNKWPDDVQAIRKLKCAFYLKLRELLQEQFHLTSQAFEDGLMVLLDSFIFRIIIVYAKEAVLLKMRKDDKGMMVMRKNKESVSLELATIHMAQHASHCLGLVHEYSSFSLTVRLARRWTNGHMLNDFIRPETIELLVASLYLDHAPFDAHPGSAFAGFVRFLRLLATHNWLTKPLIVNLNTEIQDNELFEIQSKFIALRPTLPPMCIVTPSDHTGSRWTRPQPIAMILERLCSLAKASLDVLESNAFRLTQDIVQTIFRPALHVYDVLIRLHEEFIPKRWMAFGVRKTSSAPNKTKRSRRRQLTDKEIENRFPVVDFDPVDCFLRALRGKYDRYALFFYDSCGGNVIGVLWRPKVIASDSEDIVKLESPDTDETRKLPSHRSPRISEMMEDFSIVGNGLVKEVTSLK